MRKMADFFCGHPTVLERAGKKGLKKKRAKKEKEEEEQGEKERCVLTADCPPVPRIVILTSGTTASAPGTARVAIHGDYYY